MISGDKQRAAEGLTGTTGWQVEKDDEKFVTGLDLN